MLQQENEFARLERLAAQCRNMAMMATGIARFEIMRMAEEYAAEHAALSVRAEVVERRRLAS